MTNYQITLESLLSKGVSYETILKWILKNYLSKEQASHALELMDMEVSDELIERIDDIFYDCENNVGYYDDEVDDNL